MATATTSVNRCVKCNKANVVLKCEGCLQGFCYNDYGNHRQELNKQLDDIEINRDLFQQNLNEQITQSEKHPFIQQIDQWEQDSIKKIKQTAENVRKRVFNYMNGQINEIKVELNNLTDQLKQSRQENDFMEINLNQWNKELTELNEQLMKPTDIKISYDSTSFISEIYAQTSSSSYIPNILINTKWVQNGISVVGGNGRGNGFNQLHHPWGLYVDHEHQTIYVADQNNHRIVKWKKNATSGQVVVGGNGQGNRNDQLKTPRDMIIDKNNDCFIISDSGNRRVVRWPRQNGTSGETIISDIDCCGLTMDSKGYLYVSDINRHQVKRWKIGDIDGIVVAGRNGQGSRFDQLNTPYYIFVDEDQSVYVSDYANHRVMKWMEDAKEGIVVAGGKGQGNRMSQLSHPRGVVVDQQGTVYVADCYNHRVMQWMKGATEGSVIVGGNGEGVQANQLNYPIDLSFDRQNNLYVVDNNNYRVQKFNIDSAR